MWEHLGQGEVMIHDQAHIERLMELAGAFLVGETVAVFIRTPMITKTGGEAYFSASGVRTIDLLPDQDPDQLLRFFLHEVGHHVWHSDSLKRIPLDMESVFLREKKPLWEFETVLKFKGLENEAQYQAQPEEIEADAFSHHFYEFSKQKALKRFGSDSLDDCLRVLCDTTILRSEEL